MFSLSSSWDSSFQTYFVVASEISGDDTKVSGSSPRFITIGRVSDSSFFVRFNVSIVFVYMVYGPLSKNITLSVRISSMSKIFIWSTSLSSDDMVSYFGRY